MKYPRQIGIIFTVSFLGELCSDVMPFQLPAAIYGLVVLVAALLLKLVKFEWVRETGAFLTGILPMLFIVPVVGLLDCWDSIASNAEAIVIITVVTSVVVFATAGWITQIFVKKRRKDHD